MEDERDRGNAYNRSGTDQAVAEILYQFNATAPFGEESYEAVRQGGGIREERNTCLDREAIQVIEILLKD